MNAVILYEECDLALKARARLEHAAQRADGFRWKVQTWRIESILSPACAGLSLHDAMGAHLIVFATCRPTGLSPALLDWLKIWAACRSVPDATLAIFDGTDNAMLGTPIAQDLSQFAACHGLSVLVGDESPVE